MLPIVGIIGNNHLIEGDYSVYASGLINFEAIFKVAEALPLVFPANPNLVSVSDLCDYCDGILLTGGKPNVHPEEYGEKPTPAHGKFDRDRDRLSLRLVKECVRRGQPILGICRGFQEFNVAFGGSLYPEIRELPGIMNHRMPPDGTIEEKFALRHEVIFRSNSCFLDIFQTNKVMVNSLHGQGIKHPGDRIIIEGNASDGTPEAISIKNSQGFALAVQWHPEFNALNDPVSKKLFESFGQALQEWKKDKLTGKLKVA